MIGWLSVLECQSVALEKAERPIPYWDLMMQQKRKVIHLEPPRFIVKRSYSSSSARISRVFSGSKPSGADVGAWASLKRRAPFSFIFFFTRRIAEKKRGDPRVFQFSGLCAGIIGLRNVETPKTKYQAPLSKRTRQWAFGASPILTLRCWHFLDHECLIAVCIDVLCLSVDAIVLYWEKDLLTLKLTLDFSFELLFLLCHLLTMFLKFFFHIAIQVIEFFVCGSSNGR